MFGATNNAAPTDAVAEVTTTPAPVSKKKKSKKRAAKKVATKVRRSTVKKATKKKAAKKTTKERELCRYELTSAGCKATFRDGSFASAAHTALKKAKRGTARSIAAILKKAKVKSGMDHQAHVAWYLSRWTTDELAKNLDA